MRVGPVVSYPALRRINTALGELYCVLGYTKSVAQIKLVHKYSKDAVITSH